MIPCQAEARYKFEKAVFEAYNNFRLALGGDVRNCVEASNKLFESALGVSLKLMRDASCNLSEAVEVRVDYYKRKCKAESKKEMQ